ncbi:MAG: metalloregulator ArsR/SmtB family transcription factor [Candidatus Bathyarchaeia archaeon]
MQKTEIPSSVSAELDKAGGLRHVSRLIPGEGRLRGVSKVFQALSEPLRLSILYALSATPLCVCLLRSIIRLADSKLSYHLSQLRSCGLINQRSEGKFLVYDITPLGRHMLSVCDRISL